MGGDTWEETAWEENRFLPRVLGAGLRFTDPRPMPELMRWESPVGGRAPEAVDGLLSRFRLRPFGPYGLIELRPPPVEAAVWGVARPRPNRGDAEDTARVMEPHRDPTGTLRAAHPARVGVTN